MCIICPFEWKIFEYEKMQNLRKYIFTTKSDARLKEGKGKTVGSSPIVVSH